MKVIKSKLDNQYKINLDVSLSLIALQGPEAKNVLNKVIPGCDNLKFMNGNNYVYNNEKVYITRSGYTGEDGFEISIKHNDAEIFVESLIENGSKLIGFQFF